MQRWHLTVGLVGTFALAALLVPELRGTPDAPTPPPAPAPTPLTTPPVATPQQQGALTLTAGLDRPALMEGRVEERLLVITLQAEEGEADVERPVNVAVVIDRSGSMAARGKMEFAKAAARELVASLDVEDRFSLVTFSDRANLLVSSSYSETTSPFLRAIDGIYEGGGTNLYGGLEAGLEQVHRHASDGQVNRVIVLSDGLANIGVTDNEEIARAAGRWAEQGVAVSTIGLGLDFNEDLLASMADRGGGTYRFVDEPSTLQAIFREELHQMTSVAARGVAVDVALPGAELVQVYGYEAQVSADGFRIWLGDVYGGQTRKIVAKVRVPAGQLGQTPEVAQVRLSEISADKAPYTPVAVQASVTRDAAVIDSTANVELAVLGNAAVSSTLADQAAQAYAAGRRSESLRLMRSANLIAGETASRYDAPAARAQSAALEEQEKNYSDFDASSEEGRRELKRNKEMNRGWYH
ncbi:MAG: VWA domain-containing protein [Alphaproteobacteria bacterium]|nr:VWA domain-containing protein [Alphaproteobacteria bacterium]MCB9791868.1 VWA domain-containing protein [Alphaproteobacteria bacterium]